MSNDDVCDVPDCGAVAIMWRRTGEHMNRCPRHTPTAENILLELIAELRERHHLREHCGCCCVTCEYADVMDPCPEAAMADRAEARLREVGGDAGV